MMTQQNTTMEEIQQRVQSLKGKMSKATEKDGSNLRFLRSIWLSYNRAEMSSFGNVTVQNGWFKMSVNQSKDNTDSCDWDSVKFSKLPFCKRVIMKTLQELDDNFYNPEIVNRNFGAWFLCFSKAESDWLCRVIAGAEERKRQKGR